MSLRHGESEMIVQTIDFELNSSFTNGMVFANGWDGSFVVAGGCVSTSGSDYDEFFRGFLKNIPPQAANIRIFNWIL